MCNPLAARRIPAAGLDVFEREPVSPGNPLLHLDKVVATPHVAGASFETTRGQNQGVVENVALFVSGKRPLRLVNPEILEHGTARARHLCS